MSSIRKIIPVELCMEGAVTEVISVLTESEAVECKSGVNLDKELGYIKQNIIDLNKDVEGKINISEKGAGGGVAELDESGKVLASQIPGSYDDVQEFASLSAFPEVGESGIIYIALDTNLTYRWSGSTYIAIGNSLALGETASTAYRGDRGKSAYEHTLAAAGTNPHQTTKTDVGLSNVDNTADSNKPVSKQQKAALDLKASITYVDGKIGPIDAFLDVINGEVI